ncbi:2OG-Fe(II) oxygenase [Pseudoalteromonas viridis]|uniref:2OG-Fe(II) oxygenase n=1 Tax=Pseudoalteromonas viridis TaxID=339617 RepID=A0ABX7VBQ7_9GAMM|nr:2OG-Fe(II) oxygenase [Pseudoalteromonas viridis]QTL36665.1 2OG-Fe(II) oxygenase [Pseudoalteromonas viridis]
MSHNKLLLEVEKLEHEHLEKLFYGDALVIRVKDFYPKSICEQAAQRVQEFISESPDRAKNIYESNMSSFWSVADCGVKRQRYFSTARNAMDMMRRHLTPFPSPADLVRITLDEAWDQGSVLLKYNGSSMMFGISRLWREQMEALPHQDILKRELAGDEVYQNQLGQLGVNVYLTSAEVGGELAVWNKYIDEEQYPEYVKKGIEGSYGYSEDEFGAPDVLISPEVGDLILINSLFIHAVRKIKKGERLTVSGFAGYWGDSKPLACWS